MQLKINIILFFLIFLLSCSLETNQILKTNQILEANQIEVTKLLEIKNKPIK